MELLICEGAELALALGRFMDVDVGLLVLLR